MATEALSGHRRRQATPPESLVGQLLCYEAQADAVDEYPGKKLPNGHNEGDREDARDTRRAKASHRRHVQAPDRGELVDRRDGCRRRARYAGLSWPLPEELSDEALERLLYPLPGWPFGALHPRATAVR